VEAEPSEEAGQEKRVRINKGDIALALTLCVALVGGRALWHALSLESSFDLAPNSRLPSWFIVPPRMSRSDVTVRMDYYIGPNGRTATFTFINARNGKKLARVDGTQKGSEPLNLDGAQGPPYDLYPSYEIITVGRTTEVIEHRKMEPVFYVTDDPQVLSKLGVSK
jgi:hypothetical protein